MGFMPVVIMFMPVIPAGMEGTIYAFLTTWNNTAYEVACDLSTLLECAFPVSDVQLEDGDWHNVIMMSWITSIVQLVPILFVYMSVEVKGIKVRLLPDDVEMTKKQLDPQKFWW